MERDAFEDVRADHQAPGDLVLDMQDGEDAGLALLEAHQHLLDREAAQKTLRRLLQWYYHERDKQAANRLDMAMDADMYDNLQWAPEDAATLQGRGQTPLVFNEVAPMVDWIIGTERRARVDWRVMPRSEDDVELADVKTKVLKYVSDINRVAFNRSRAFSDAVKVGVGWMDDGARDDPTQDVVYSRWEDWRNVLWDSAAYEGDLSDARYIFRWRWVDEDVALLMFPDRAEQIRRAVEDTQHSSMADWEEDTWYTAEDFEAKGGKLHASGSGLMVDTERRRVKLIECQYRQPAQVKIVMAGPLKGAFYHQDDQALAQALAQSGGTIIDKTMMRVHFAVFTESHLLAQGASPYRHNRFTLTPVWCYRRGRDRMPYGVIRRVRDLQMDLNKRASKALWLLNTNQIIADEGATEDWELLREEADRPDGLIVKKAGKDLILRRDTDAATGQIQMMTLDAQGIQKSAGISNENLGRQTNASSGEAIKARQLQGSVVTTEPFDNLRQAVQAQGEKQLALIEQFYSEEKVVRLTGAKGGFDWIKVNQPELQQDGTVRFLNDITASAADFVVSEADYAGTMRQTMFDALNQLAMRLPPEIALRMMTVAMEFSDLPNKDEVAEQIRRVTGERDPDKPMTPEEQQAMQEQMAQQAEAMQMQREQAMLAMQEQQAKVRETIARATKLEAEAQAAGQGDAEALARQVRMEADREIERLTEQLRQAQSQAQARVAVAEIDAAADERVALIKAASNEKIAAMDHLVEQTTRRLERDTSMANSLPSQSPVKE